MRVLRTRTLSTKVTENEYDRCAALAGDHTVGDWLRQVVLTAAPLESTAAAHRTILGEMLALRKILLNLQFAAAAGEPLTRERMLGWIAEADADKTEKASARLAAAE